MSDKGKELEISEDVEIKETTNNIPAGVKETEGTVIQEKKTREETVNEKMVELISEAGTIELVEEQEEILYASVEDEDVEIRPDGQLYLPWGWYQNRLKKTFGFKWTLFPGGPVHKEKNLMIREWWLVIDGKPYSNCYGACEYHPNNPVMNYDDAVEGTRSNAIMRLCKHIGVATELWNPSWVKQWKDEYATTYKDKYGDTKWRKKNPKSSKYAEKDKPTIKTNKKKELPINEENIEKVFTEEELQRAYKKESWNEGDIEKFANRKKGRMHIFFTLANWNIENIHPEVVRKVRLYKDKHSKEDWNLLKSGVLNTDKFKDADNQKRIDMINDLEERENE